MWDQEADAKKKNIEKTDILNSALEARGYAACLIAAGAVHAAIRLTQGHHGYLHPRPLCQPASPRFYAGFYGKDHAATEPVTCKRCLAGMAKRGIEV